jgi:hypothetical protein
VNVVYKRRHVVETTPNCRIARDVRKNGAHPSL